MMIANILSVGDRVRVNDIHDGTKKCAMIACCNSDATYDVLYDSRTDDRTKESDEEEVSVQSTRVAKLLPFEMTSLSELQPLQAKEYGNILFKLEDLDSATRYYKSALKSLLRSEKISVGSSVLVQCKKAGIGELFSAIVSDVEDGSYDVIFDDERLGEEGSMDISRLHILAQGDCFDVGSDTHHDIQQESDFESSTQLPRTAVQLSIPAIKREIESKTALQRALCINLARCYMRRSPPLTGWAIRMASLSIGISKYMIQQLEECSSQSQGATCSFPQRKSSSHIDHVVDSNLNSKQVRILQLSAAVKKKSSGENIDESRHNRFESSIERGNPFALSELLRTFVTLIMTIFASLYKYVCYREMIGTEQKEDMNQTNKNVHQSLDLIANPMTDAFKPDSPKNVLQVEPIGKESVLQKQLSDGLYLRSKAYLIASRPQLAKKDAIRLSSFDSKKSAALLKEIDAFLAQRKKSNRKLARDVAEWVDQAVRIAAENTRGGRERNHADLDLDLEVEDDENDDEGG